MHDFMHDRDVMMEYDSKFPSKQDEKDQIPYPYPNIFGFSTVEFNTDSKYGQLLNWIQKTPL